MSTFHSRDTLLLAVGADGIAVRKRVPFDATANWHAGYLDMQGHRYAVQFAAPTAALLRQGLGLLVRPAHVSAVKEYHSAPFEAFFGFGSHCDGFKCTTVTGVAIKNVTGLPYCG